MFLQQAMNPWFVIQRTSQVLMILLAVAMLVVPILHQPEADAVPVLLIGAVVAAVIGAGALIYVSADKPCPADCGDSVPKSDAHWTTHSCGLGYYGCSYSAHHDYCYRCNVWTPVCKSHTCIAGSGSQ